MSHVVFDVFGVRIKKLEREVNEAKEEAAKLQTRLSETERRIRSLETKAHPTKTF